MIDVNFGNLFTVELLHSYYKDQLCTDFSIAVSTETSKVINGHKMIVKQHNNQLYAGIHCSGNVNPLKPFIPVETGMQLTFFMKLNNSLFYNFTNLSSTNPGKIYYFTNRNNNVSNAKTFLSSPIPLYNNANTYHPGDLATNAANEVYRAIVTNDPLHQFDLTHTDHWMKVDKNQYLSEKDALQWLPPVSTYQLGSVQPSAGISVLGYDTAAATYTKPVLSKTITFSNPVSSFTLDLSGLQPGKYSLTINGKQQWIYINDELNGSKVFAVIDIFNDAAPAPCQLVDAAGLLVSPMSKFSIYFLNRATIWKYILASNKLGKINDAANLYHFANPASVITSLTPIPLSNKALNLKLTVNNHDYSPIACADPQRLSTIIKGTDTYPCSEIFLNF
ncbi:hypothetical protein [Mucilaginibacter pocheonensis]|uniref:Uncharacterized protein n=1 Tax=Mucilaginibacter pocheonensis TaxID=398050 RepID=A0ABU1TD64_9SPHI|nr:hypothetical protein [Mucilaginibacter pocheonensis]MDR6943329.1 hypothetical protein [Mucilaginibacter pocheonensis]